ncbi:hypothetical protein [Candidatus Nitrospira allomarina]|uniref:Uncharacterized protein n=1 Tax=Candidatus Nitrospira allomarina TaxID=3020900 RepID=A0AA96JS68_9BACT|nr:hypothetical protein [Candidatus Nitrospira allomarina]WNM57750.1 hypothetical protein PP769_17535 [Candidatus Nitrospira allomarina]
MNLLFGILSIRTWALLTSASIVLSGGLGLAETGIDGFRDLKFGMTEQEVAALPACNNSKECLYELTDKNRYVELTYLPDEVSDTTEPTGKLANISIDMGLYTDDWYQQLQIILGASYDLTQDLTEANKQSFLSGQLDELNSGFENGQVLLKVVRRPFGNLELKVVYQNAVLAKAFIQERQATISSK